MRSKVTPRTIGVGQKVKGILARETLGSSLACLGSIVNRVTEHFSTFSGIIHSVDQSAMTCNADWTTAVASSTELDEAQTARSSANKENWREGMELRRQERESMKNRKRKGPKTLRNPPTETKRRE